MYWIYWNIAVASGLVASMQHSVHNNSSVRNHKLIIIIICLMKERLPYLMQQQHLLA